MPEQVAFKFFPGEALAKAEMINSDRVAAVDAAFNQLGLSDEQKTEVLNHIMQGNLHPQHIFEHGALKAAKENQATKRAVSTISNALFDAHDLGTKAAQHFSETDEGKKFVEVREAALKLADAKLGRVAAALPRSNVPAELQKLIKGQYLPYYLFVLGVHASKLPEANAFGERKKFGPTRASLAVAEVFRISRAKGAFPRFGVSTGAWLEGKIRKA